MGDGGALLLGLLMASSTVLVGGQTDDPYSGQAFFFYLPLFIPFFVMGVPILDTLFAIVRRARKRLSPAEADKDHLHHRLMRLGHGHRRSVLILWTWTAILSGFVLYPVYNGQGRRRRAPRGGGPRTGAVHLLPPRRPSCPQRRGTGLIPTPHEPTFFAGREV